MKNRWLWGLILLALILAAYSLWGRHKALDPGNRVELILDYDQAVAFCVRNGVEVEGYLEQMAGAGIGTLMVGEVSLKDLYETGRVTLMQASEFAARRRTEGLEVPGWLQQGDRLLVLGAGEEVTAALESRLGEGRVEHHLLEDGTPVVVLPAGDRKELFEGRFDRPLVEMGLGPDVEGLELASRLGFAVVVRFSQDTLPDYHSLKGLEGLEGIAFAGGIPGGPSARKDLVRGARDLGLRYVLVERGQFAGEEVFTRELPVLKVHGTYAGERIDSMVRSVRERSIRGVLLAPRNLTNDPARNVELSLSRVVQLRKTLQDEGFEPGRAGSIGQYRVPGTVRLVLTLGVLAAGLLLLGYLLPLPGIASALLLAAGEGLFFLLGRYGGSDLAAEAAAFLASLVFPTLAGMILLDGLSGKRWTPAAALRDLLVPAAVVVCGGLILHALLGDSDYLLQVRGFRGVRASLVLPVGMSAFIGFWRNRSSLSMRKFWSYPVTPLMVFLAAGAVIAAGVIMLRAGNFPLIPVPELEVKLRLWLDEVMRVRPRTKEFLVGHPAVLASGYLFRRWPALKPFAWGGASAAAIGYSSIANTFSHLHTPLGLTLFRTVNGLLAGGAIGLILVAALALGGAFLGRWQRSYRYRRTGF